jgi:hypothetical protein
VKKTLKLQEEIAIAKVKLCRLTLVSGLVQDRGDVRPVH